MGETKLQEEDLKYSLYLEVLRRLRPLDDAFMRCIFKDNIPLSQLVLRILLGEPDLIVETVETQRDNKRLVGGRSLSFDVYTGDDRNRKQNIEIQRADKGASRKRARYHSSVMDIENLHAGQYFDKLPETWMIMITENDQFHDGKPFHRIERVDMDTDGKPLFNDGEHILFVNGAYEGDSEIGRLMHDFRCRHAEDMYFEEFRNATKRFKETKEGVKHMSGVIEEYINSIQDEIKDAAKYQNSVEIAKAMISRGKLTLEEIAEDTGLSITDVREIAGGRTA